MSASKRRPSPERARPRRWLAVLLGVVWLTLGVAPAFGQQRDGDAGRAVALEWSADGNHLLVSFAFHDAVDTAIRRKLGRGLPTTFVLAAEVRRDGTHEVLSSTAQTCKATWHVWNEAYRVEIVRPDSSTTRWTTTVQGVLRRCAEAHRLPAAQRSQIPQGASLYLSAQVDVNPISRATLGKIKLWISNPSSNNSAPGDVLFSTFTGLFMQRIGEAERTLRFRTAAALPRATP